jgi:hypothetical protein
MHDAFPQMVVADRERAELRMRTFLRMNVLRFPLSGQSTHDALRLDDFYPVQEPVMTDKRC